VFAAERRRLQHGVRSAPAAIDRYLLPAGCSTANPPTAVAAVDGTERQTDSGPLHIPCSAHYVRGINQRRYFTGYQGLQH